MGKKLVISVISMGFYTQTMGETTLISMEL
jgi:hypothetical protein